ncbi:hypothetical protein OMAG_000026 [Candidatus Omnitrophus magneticus]|uniref:Uncharacterized protein n=1 Tax=Candidatus Omnitrophus magneticus TaxID=1609969 RepID=A0A0F0CVB7_9BACT|nr:hypothetical protein OMAG_002964 [Candidatus Omnitrophus magneticus]KJJ83784.1 hypothetical protein OMAG_002349 [Candidatus Omnitrophus magneticus]KJJ83832.1 hypothetical protein OMAG_002304 [Candidatus Omnitrophus magneticus]KJJ84018.1 hypothetical protein OMAG_002115 [Candidatus Omnitrophus magneticus]KJJ84189.1 hypothetical protein OMAG_001944 [Candidatus Omnitrophus magneticus]
MFSLFIFLCCKNNSNKIKIPTHSFFHRGKGSLPPLDARLSLSG